MSNTNEMENPEKQTQDEEKQTKTQHNICWTPPYGSKHK
jgi:hypothetical protein